MTNPLYAIRYTPKPCAGCQERPIYAYENRRWSGRGLPARGALSICDQDDRGSRLKACSIIAQRPTLGMLTRERAARPVRARADETTLLAQSGRRVTGTTGFPRHAAWAMM